MKLKNHEELVQELAGYLKSYDVDLNDYHTDVYLYTDENGNGELTEFINVGGRSWLDDNHITIYTDNPHTGFGISDYFNDLDGLADACGVGDANDLRRLYAAAEEIDIDDVDDAEIWAWAKNEYYDEIVAEVETGIEDWMGKPYAAVADEILTAAEGAED